MDILYLLLLVTFIFTLVIQVKVSTTFNKFAHISAGRGKTGAEVARRILDAHGLFDVRIERVHGHLTDEVRTAEDVDQVRLELVHILGSSYVEGVAFYAQGDGATPSAALAGADGHDGDIVVFAEGGSHAVHYFTDTALVVAGEDRLLADDSDVITHRGHPPRHPE